MNKMAIRHVLETFADGTTMHGVPKVIHARSLLARCFWALVCIGAGSMFCMQMIEVLQRYFSYPKKVTIEVVPTAVPFPSISMCNMRNLDVYILNTLNQKFIDDHLPINHINTSSHPFVREYMKTTAKYSPLWYKYQSEYPLQFRHIFSRTTFSANIDEDIIKQAAVQLDEFIVNCYFGTHKCNNTIDFQWFFDPYYFNCFTYNAPSSEGEYALSEGIENGWTSIVFSGSGMLMKNDEIRILPGLHEYKSAVSASEGVRVVIHPPGTRPFPFTEGFDVPPGFSASFGIRPRRINRIGLPHGNCSESNPFGGGEGGIRYRTMACQKMCLQRYIIKNCTCKDNALPDLPGMNADIPTCRNNDLPDECMFNATTECLTIFFGLYSRMQCMNDRKDEFARNSSIMAACGCNPPCNEVSYDVSYSLSKWPATGYEGDSAFYDVFYLENFWERFNGTPKYDAMRSYFSEPNRNESMKDFARLNAYIADSNVIITQEREDYSSTQLVSDIGGQLGLWVGISIITLAEVLELICDVCRYMLRAQRPAPSRHYVDRYANSSHNNHHPHHSGVGGDENDGKREGEDDHERNYNNMFVSALDYHPSESNHASDGRSHHPHPHDQQQPDDRDGAASPFMRMPYSETIFR